MFSKSNSFASETEVPKLVIDSSLCDLSNEQLEVGCMLHEERADWVKVKRESSIAKGSLDSSTQDHGDISAHRIYWYIMYMFRFGRQITRTVKFEDIRYLFNYFNVFLLSEVALDALNMQWMHAVKEPDFDNRALSFTFMASAGMSNIDLVKRWSWQMSWTSVIV